MLDLILQVIPIPIPVPDNPSDVDIEAIAKCVGIVLSIGTLIALFIAGYEGVDDSLRKNIFYWIWLTTLGCLAACLLLHLGMISLLVVILYIVFAGCLYIAGHICGKHYHKSF